MGADWLRLLTGEKRGYGYVDNDPPELSIAVLPEHRRRGIRTELLREILDTAKRSFPAVSLSVSRQKPFDPIGPGR